MPLAVGTRLGPYEVTGLLGAGGMGEVYRARDTKLNRDVALKVLPEALAHDTERLARFEREARTLASLNHPHIAQIYGLEESDGITALVMELVEGPTLADRIAGRPLPMDEALPIARQIAEALEAAHEQGIIHRDLKPANIKVRPDGAVKVLDFGLAKALDPIPSAIDATTSPTITSPAMMTGVGVLLGTAAYMSPEQAKGRAADKRSDIWAFGSVLYEMLTGRRAFEGDDLSDTLANVLKSQPDWKALPADVPAHVRMLIQRCLAKDRRDRIAAMSVALFVMTDTASVGPAAGEPARQRPLWRRAVLPTAAAMLMSAVVGALFWMVMRQSPARVTRFVIAETGPASLVADQVSTAMAITPDGTRIVYAGANALLVRATDQFEPTALTGLGVPRAPFLSPDGRRVGFVDITVPALKWVDITGGPAQLITSQDGRSRGATWGDDGNIIFATIASSGLQRVAADGGTPELLTTPNAERGEADHLWPHFLPGARAVLFTITSLSGGIDAAQVAVLDLRTGTAKVLFRGGSQAQYVAGSHLVYVAAGTLRAVGFDLDRLAVIGASVPLPERITILATDTAQFNVALDTGSLVYVEKSTVAAVRTLVWVDRQGHEEPVAAEAGVRAYEYPRLSPDGTRVAVSISTQDLNDDNIWMWEVAQKRLRRATSKPGVNQVPLWMPGGRHFVFNAPEGAARSLFLQAADGTGGTEPLTQNQNQDPVLPSSVSPDGKHLLFSQQGAGSQADIMMLTLENRTVVPLTSTPFIERNGEISPDGQWLAYQVNESGQFQIAVRPFPNVNAGIWPITEGGGSQPLWAADSRELFYRAPGGAIMSVRLERGPVWTTPAKLIDGPYYAGRGLSSDARTYDLGRDKRFLLIKEGGGQPAAASIRVILNWREELKLLVPIH